MLSTRRLILIAAFAAFGGVAAAATAPKPEAKPASKPEAKKGEAKKAAAPGPRKLRGKTETLACRLGTEDRHARIAVVTIGGIVDSFAYYSKWKPRTCSVYLQRDRDMYSKWVDSGNLTTVTIEKGAFLVENKKGQYHFIFRDVDRERYCGMDGVINGTLTIRKGSDACELGGDIMVEGTPLGQAFVQREEDKAPVGLLPVTAQEAAKAPPDRSPPATPTPPEKPAEPQAQPAAQATPPAAAATAGSAPATAETAAKAAAAPAPNTPDKSAAAADTAVKPAAVAAAKSEPAKADEPAASGGIRGFFRSLGERKGPEGSPGQ